MFMDDKDFFRTCGRQQRPKIMTIRKPEPTGPRFSVRL